MLPCIVHAMCIWTVVHQQSYMPCIVSYACHHLRSVHAANAAADRWIFPEKEQGGECAYSGWCSLQAECQGVITYRQHATPLHGVKEYQLQWQQQLYICHVAKTRHKSNTRQRPSTRRHDESAIVSVIDRHRDFESSPTVSSMEQ